MIFPLSKCLKLPVSNGTSLHIDAAAGLSLHQNVLLLIDPIFPYMNRLWMDASHKKKSPSELNCNM